MKTTTKQKAKKTAAAAVNKTKQAAKKTGSFISKNPQTALYVGLGITAIIVGFVVVKNAKKKVDTIFNGDQNIDDNVSITLGDLKINTSKLSINQSTAKILAQQLLDAMNAKQPFWGTDEDAILEVFKKITPEDFKLIFWAFGKKDYNGNNSPPTGFWSNLDSYEKRNLLYWLGSELGKGDGEVYRVVKDTVEKAGFTFA